MEPIAINKIEEVLTGIEKMNKIEEDKQIKKKKKKTIKQLFEFKKPMKGSY